ncbi:MAG TPA: hypothetical protein VN878_03580 [Usitatibacter sp.]|nr:hypothetical protein [Usitatibacter sp.]
MKKVLIVVAIIAIAVAGGLYYASHSIDLIVKLALEHYGPDVTGVAIRVAEVSISPHDGRGSVKGVELGSPQGFTAPRSARLGEIRVAIDPATITEPVIVIHEIRVEAPAIIYERSAAGTNLDAIQRNIESYVKRGDNASSSPSSALGGPKRKFVIERLSIRGARITMTNMGLQGQGISFDLPDIELRDLGKREHGLTASEVSNIVANTVIARIGQKVLTNLELLRKGGVEGAIDALKGLFR